MSKFRITLKDPDGPIDCINDAAKAQVDAISGLDPEERDAVIEARSAKLSKLADRWMPYGEYVTIEIDDETGAATVVPAKDAL